MTTRPAAAGADSEAASQAHPAGERVQGRRAIRRHRQSVAALLVSHALSHTGNVVVLFTVPFYVLSIGGSGVQVGIAAFFATFPVVVGGPLGGVLVERIGYRRSSIVADVISGTTVAALPLAALTVGLPFPALITLVFLGGLFDTPGQTARSALLPQLSRAAAMPLERSVGLLDSATRLGTLIGAPVAGLLVATLGPVAAFYAPTAAFVLAASLTAALVATAGTDQHAPTPGTSQPAGYWRDLAEGARFVLRDPLMRAIAILVMVTNMLDAARANALLPLYAADRLGGAAALGLIVAVFGGSALLGSLSFGMVAHRLPRRVTFSVCFVLVGAVSHVPFAMGLPLPVLVAGAVVAGGAAGALNPILGAVELERVPAFMRARVFGLLTAVAWAGMPIGGLLAGIAVDLAGLTVCFAVAGAVYVAVTLVPLRGGVWRLMERDAVALHVPGRAG